MARARRSTEEVKRLAEQARTLVEGGMSKSAASKQVGIAESVYARVIEGYRSPAQKKKRAKKARVERGSIRADSLPPRPVKRATNGTGQPIDMSNIAKLATRIAAIDRKLAKQLSLQRDREHFAKRLVELLTKVRK